MTWYQNASEIPSYNGSLFTIHNATPADSLVYQCIWYSVAQNVYNKSTWALVVNLQKESTVNPSVVGAIVISLSDHWSVTATGGVLSSGHIH